jgi:hypothetical protein
VLLKSYTHSFVTDILLNDFLVAENAPFQSEITSSMYSAGRAPRAENSDPDHTSSGSPVQQSPSNRRVTASSFSNLLLSVFVELLWKPNEFSSFSARTRSQSTC